MKKITLTIGERLAALKLFDAFKGSISALAVVLDDVKSVAVTTDEWEKANRIVTKGDNNSESWKWNEDDAATHKEVELGDESVKYLAGSIKEKSDKGEITLMDVALISLNKKLS